MAPTSLLKALSAMPASTPGLASYVEASIKTPQGAEFTSQACEQESAREARQGPLPTALGNVIGMLLVACVVGCQADKRARAKG